MASDPEAEFRHELEVFGNEVEEAIQSFYSLAAQLSERSYAAVVRISRP
jgi:hypothetical protein